MFVPFSAQGANCYSQLQAEAEQGIRIHSELMVIGLNCQHMGARYGMDLYGQYRNFTKRHVKLISGYEEILVRFFSNRGDRQPVDSLNAMRTQFANKISRDAAGMRPDIFCSKYAPRIVKASELDQPEYRQWASTFFPSHPVSYPICTSSQ